MSAVSSMGTSSTVSPLSRTRAAEHGRGTAAGPPPGRAALPAASVDDKAGVVPTAAWLRDGSLPIGHGLTRSPRCSCSRCHQKCTYRDSPSTKCLWCRALNSEGDHDASHTLYLRAPRPTIERAEVQHQKVVEALCTRPGHVFRYRFQLRNQLRQGLRDATVLHQVRDVLPTSCHAHGH